MASNRFHGRDPEKEFTDPRNLDVASSLSVREKLEILENWRADLMELQRAEEENMPSTNPDSGAIGKKLSEVAMAMELLREGKEDETVKPDEGDGGS